jgi:glycosyltransferase involved in cell wall biosynthesis
MKILQVLPTLSAGGAEGFTTNLGVSLSKAGAHLKYMLLAGVRGQRGAVLLSRLREAGVEVLGVEERNIRSPMNLVRLVRLIRSWRPDIVQANLFSAEVICAVARLLTAGSGARYVRRLASADQAGYRLSWVVRRLDRAFRLTIACSPAVASAYRSYHRVCSDERLVTINNGGYLSETIPTDTEKSKVRQLLDISEEAFVVAHIGRMLGGRRGTGLDSEPKAQDILLKAFARAFGGDFQCALVLVGDGPLRPDAELLAKDLGIARQTRFLGLQPEPWPALKAANLFCFPSRYEGLPNVLPEAASCGLPVVASDIPEIRDLYPGGAWLLKAVDDVAGFAEGMRVVRESKGEYGRRAHAAAEGFRKRFSMQSCAGKYLEAYQAILK